MKNFLTKRFCFFGSKLKSLVSLLKTFLGGLFNIIGALIVAGLWVPLLILRVPSFALLFIERIIADIRYSSKPKYYFNLLRTKVITFFNESTTFWVILMGSLYAVVAHIVYTYWYQILVGMGNVLLILFLMDRIMFLKALYIVIYLFLTVYVFIIQPKDKFAIMEKLFHIIKNLF